MKPKARVFDMASQSILVVNFFWKSFSHVLVRDGMQVQLTPVLEFQEQSKKSLL